MGVSGLSGRGGTGDISGLDSTLSSTLWGIGESGGLGDGRGEGQGLEGGVEAGLLLGEEVGLFLTLCRVKSWGSGPRRRLFGRPAVA